MTGVTGQGTGASVKSQTITITPSARHGFRHDFTHCLFVHLAPDVADVLPPITPRVNETSPFPRVIASSFFGKIVTHHPRLALREPQPARILDESAPPARNWQSV
jgi:hypothetical protein